MDLHEFFRSAKDIGLSPEERTQCRLKIASSCGLEGHVRIGSHARHLNTMEQKHIRELSERGGRIRLDSREHAAIRHSLRKYMHDAPIPVWSEAEISSVPLLSPAFWIGRFRLFPIVASLVLLTGAVSVAAERAEPDGMLYSFKILVNENLLGATKLTAEAKTKWSAERASRRLHEAVTLAATERLDAKSIVVLHDALIDQLQNMSSNVERLAMEGNDEIALGILMTFEALVEAHGAVLAELMRAKGAGDDAVFRQFLAGLDIQTEAIASTRARIAQRLLATVGSVENVTLLAEEKAKVRVDDARSAEGVSANVSAEVEVKAVPSRVGMKVTAAEASLHDAVAKRDAGADIEALSLAKEGLQAAEEASLLMEVDRMLEQRGRASNLTPWQKEWVDDSRRSVRDRTEGSQERLEVKRQQEEEDKKSDVLPEALGL